MKKRSIAPFQQGYDAGYAPPQYSRECPFAVDSADRAEWHAGFNAARRDRRAQLKREEERKATNQ